MVFISCATPLHAIPIDVSSLAHGSIDAVKARGIGWRARMGGLDRAKVVLAFIDRLRGIWTIKRCCPGVGPSEVGHV